MEIVQLKDLKLGDKIKTISGVEFVKVNSNDSRHCQLATIAHADFCGTDKKVDYKCVDYGLSKYRQWLNSDKENNCFTEMYPGQLVEGDQNKYGFLYNLPKELKDKLDTFDSIQYLKRVYDRWETSYITNTDKVCMASLYELGHARNDNNLGAYYSFFTDKQDKKKFLDDTSVLTRTPKDNDTYYSYFYSNKIQDFDTNWGFITSSSYLVALLNVKNDLILKQKDNGTYEIIQNVAPAKININKADKNGVNIDITGTCKYNCYVKINNTQISSSLIDGVRNNFQIVDFNEYSSFKSNDEMNVEIEVVCVDDKDMKTVKYIKYKKNIHNIDKVKRFYLNGKTYDVKNITVDNTGLVTLELENYHDEAVKDNVIFVIDGKYSVDCVSNLNGQEEKLECNYLSSTMVNWILEDKYEIPVKNANNNFKITLNCEGLYDKQDIISGVMAAFKYYSE